MTTKQDTRNFKGIIFFPFPNPIANEANLYFLKICIPCLVDILFSFLIMHDEIIGLQM